MKPLQIKVQILRKDEGKTYWQEYRLSLSSTEVSVLEVLQTIYETQDQSLAFSYGCRYKRCGLCGMMINGKPRLACLTKAETELTLKPLQKIPVMKDLIIDRSFLWGLLAKHSLYVREQECREFPQIMVPEYFTVLSRCVECLCCIPACPYYRHGEKFAGPFLFVKLAQLLSNPKDVADRHRQALDLGIDLCRQCRRCVCPNGIPIYKTAIESLLIQ